MRNIVKCFLIWFGLFCLMLSNTFAQARIIDDEPVLTIDEKKVIGKEIRDKEDPIRGGALSVVKEVNGIYNNPDLYEQHSTGLARERMTNYIKGLINYILALLGLVTLIYLLVHGFMILTAGGNKEKSQKGMQGVKYALIALVGLGLSWFLLSLIFWLLQYLTN